MIRQIGSLGNWMLGFAAFLEQGRLGEIEFLARMLAEWHNWGGSLRVGNFFAVGQTKRLIHRGFSFATPEFTRK